MSRFVTTRPLTIPAGTEMVVNDELGDGGLVAFVDHELYAQLFIGRRAALEDGYVVARPTLRLVEGETP